MRNGPVVLALMVGTVVAAQQPANPRQQPGATITMFAPGQHDLYDGHYVLSANRIHMVGGLNDPAGWDHMDNEAKTVKPVAGTAEIDVNNLTNTGKFEARLKIPEGDLVLAIDKFNEFNPCQNGGIVGFLHEHGTDSGCGDNNWPKSRVPRGLGIRPSTLNGKSLYDNYEMHFMITQGIRDRKTLRVNYPMANKKQPAGEVNPATQQIDFYIRVRSRIRRTSRTRGLHALLRDGGYVEVVVSRPTEARIRRRHSPPLRACVSRNCELPKAAHQSPARQNECGRTPRTKEKAPPKCAFNCDRNVIRRAQNLEEHRGLQTHTEEPFWRANSLIANALMRLGVCSVSPRNSLSKRAPSTTPTSFPFEINDLRAV